MNISEIMTTELVTCSPNDTLSQVADVMQQTDVGACPVVEQEKMIGIVTDRDITIRAVAKGFDPNNTFVSQVMSTDVVFGSPDMSLEDACELMQDNQVRRLPIVQNNKLVGIVTLADMAIDLEEDEMLAETLEKISMPSH